mgnify:CR=1 FL=1
MPAVVNKVICNGCEGFVRQECIFNCPYDCIVLIDGKAFVSEGVCYECKIWIEACPLKAIVLI